MKMRHVHNLSHYKLATFDMGELVPVGLFEVLPNDSFRHSVSMLLRCSPLLSPVMHPITVRLHNWFIPFRLLWEDWEDFITGGADGEGDGSVFPTWNLVGGGQPEGSLAEYLGVPDSVAVGAVSALPFRAYALVFNEFYRDKDLVSEVAMSVAGGNDSTTNLTLQKVAWEKDYFTAARPWPQKGPDVTIPLGDTAPVYGTGQPINLRLGANTRTLQYGGAGGSGDTRMYYSGAGIAGANADALFATEAQAATASLEADLQGASSATINQLRLSMALQRYQEAAAMYGSEYVDYLRMQFGVKSSDARMQRPEYLGGGKQTISFSEVIQTAPEFDSNDGVAQLRGHGIAAMRSRGYTRFFEEHGYVLTLASVRPRAMYRDGLPHHWKRATKEDFYQPQLEYIGQKEVYNREVRASHAAPTDVFGYQDRYAEYRHQPSAVHGEFRSTLNHWHLGRTFASDPALNSTFVECTPGKRIHQVQNADQLWCMVNHNLRARRVVGPPNVGRIF